MILGIDTSLGTTVAVVEDDGTVLAQADSADRLAHAEVIGTLLREVVDAADAAPQRTSAAITGVAAGMGPGPFTGLRIGIAAARAFALGRGLLVTPVVSHDALALQIALQDTLDDPSAGQTPFAVVTDARRREAAYSVYDGVDDDGLPHRTHGPTLVSRADVDDVLDALHAARHDVTSAAGAMIALAACRARAAGRIIGPADALYLRSPDVAVPAAPKRVGR